MVASGGPGRYTLYKLTKRDLGTLEAIDLICRRWNLAGRRVSYGGLKDRHALTMQYLTIFDGPSVSIDNPAFRSSTWDGSIIPISPPISVAIGSTWSSATSPRDALKRRSIWSNRSRPTDCRTILTTSDSGRSGYSGQFIAHAWLTGDAERRSSSRWPRPNPSDRSAAKAAESHPATELGQVERGESPPGALAVPQYRHLSGRSPDRFSWRLCPDAPRAT